MLESLIPEPLLHCKGLSSCAMSSEEVPESFTESILRDARKALQNWDFGAGFARRA